MKRGRFAPTPSGHMHIGNALSALLAWLQIRSQEGLFVLRIEDIDKPRSRPEFVRQIIDDLRWLGLDWDEGPDVGGPYGPYEQGARGELYEAALSRLADSGRLYPCYCSRAELMAIASAPHGLASEGPAYPGTCRSLTAEARTAKAAGKTPSLRFAMPDRPIAFDDLVHGPQLALPGAGGDFVVQRADGIVGYQLAVVVDDDAMRITDVLRGADLLDSTPRQIALYEALGKTPPQFAHVPLLHAPDGQRLSKRHSALALAEIRASGIHAEQAIGWIAYFARLIDRPEPVQAADLVAGFDLAKVPHEPITISASVWERMTGG